MSLLREAELEDTRKRLRNSCGDVTSSFQRMVTAQKIQDIMLCNDFLKIIMQNSYLLESEES